MKYAIEFELPDNETVLDRIKTADVYWSVWGYSGVTTVIPSERKTGRWEIVNIPPSVGTHCSVCGWSWSENIDAVKLNKTLSLIRTNY